MTRPGIVRADTLDLQDQDSPSAQDHSKQPVPAGGFGNGVLATHQASEVKHVIEERHSEEQHLQDAWNNSTEDLGTRVDGDQQNGRHEQSGAESDGEGGADDDMMDRMSSSPSIDDGAYPLLRPIWPERSSSLMLPGAAFNAASQYPSPSAHFLKSVAYHDEEFDLQASTQQSSSPFQESPVHYPLHSHGLRRTLKAHHLLGEYRGDEGYHDQDESDKSEHGASPQHTSFKFHRQHHKVSADLPTGSGSDIATTRLVLGTLHTRSSVNLPHYVDDDDLSDLLSPSHDPLLNICPQDGSVSPASSSDSWTTASDLCLSDFGERNQRDYRDDDSRELSLYSDERFVDSGWGGECLRDVEDIDFDFVYALHTFVATVEGQANATKGDTMVLLDDSNSYWWLVRVVKDSSIGYLPAEHIETPTERLARLNKHRNVDLSAAMLGDNAERSKNPLKKAIRRRNAKTVQFAAPTYVEASDYDYSSDEEEPAAESVGPVAAAATNGDHTKQNGQQQQAAATNTSSVNGTSEQPKAIVSTEPAPKDIRAPVDEPLASPPLVDRTEGAPLKSRKGTPRNAESFLKDDTVETRKITLTPNLLRDDNSSIRSGENARSSSMESLDKSIFAADKSTKEDKKKKEKKQGMLSGLFKTKKKDKKDTKAKMQDDFVSENDVEKVASEASKQLPLPAADSSPKGKSQRKASTTKGKGKLTKAQPSTVSSGSQESIQFLAELEGSQVAVEAPTGLEDEIDTAAPATVKSQKTKKAKSRVTLDDFDEQAREDPTEDLPQSTLDAGHTFMHGTEVVHIPTTDYKGQSSEDEEDDEEDSIEEIYEGTSTPPSIIDIPQGADKSSEEEHYHPNGDDITAEQTNDASTAVPAKPQSPQPSVETAPSIPSLSRTPPPGESAPGEEPRRQASLSSTASSAGHLVPSRTSATSPTWSDAGLRAWLDGDNDIKDMLVVIHDKSDIKPVEKDHPLMANLFAEESKTLKGLSDQLDSLLGGFLQRRQTISA